MIEVWHDNFGADEDFDWIDIKPITIIDSNEILYWKNMGGDDFWESIPMDFVEYRLEWPTAILLFKWEE